MAFPPTIWLQVFAHLQCCINMYELSWLQQYQQRPAPPALGTMRWRIEKDALLPFPTSLPFVPQTIIIQCCCMPLYHSVKGYCLVERTATSKSCSALSHVVARCLMMFSERKQRKRTYNILSWWPLTGKSEMHMDRQLIFGLSCLVLSICFV